MDSSSESGPEDVLLLTDSEGEMDVATAADDDEDDDMEPSLQQVLDEGQPEFPLVSTMIGLGRPKNKLGCLKIF